MHTHIKAWTNKKCWQKLLPLRHRVSLPKLCLLKYKSFVGFQNCYQCPPLRWVFNTTMGGLLPLAEKINKHCWNFQRTHFLSDTVWVTFIYRKKQTFNLTPCHRVAWKTMMLFFFSLLFKSVKLESRNFKNSYC